MSCHFLPRRIPNIPKPLAKSAMTIDRARQDAYVLPRNAVRSGPAGLKEFTIAAVHPRVVDCPIGDVFDAQLVEVAVLAHEILPHLAAVVDP